MADKSTMQLVIASVAQTRFSGEARAVNVPGEAGVMTVLPHHEPLVTTLRPGTITVRDEAGREHKFEIDSGVLEVSHNRVVVLL